MVLRWNISFKSSKNHCELEIKYFTQVFMNKVGGQPEVDPALRSIIITIVTILMIITIEHHHHHHHHPHHKPEVDSALVDASVAGVDVVQHKATWLALTSK